VQFEVTERDPPTREELKWRRRSAGKPTISGGSMVTRRSDEH
jgi:hypothetical protein